MIPSSHPLIMAQRLADRARVRSERIRLAYRLGRVREVMEELYKENTDELNKLREAGIGSPSDDAGRRAEDSGGNQAAKPPA
jgi:predicted component of type VI protein secretion system